MEVINHNLKLSEIHLLHELRSDVPHFSISYPGDAHDLRDGRLFPELPLHFQLHVRHGPRLSQGKSSLGLELRLRLEEVLSVTAVEAIR